MEKIVLWIQNVLLPTLGPAGLFVVAFFDSSFLSLPEINDILVVSSCSLNPRSAWIPITLATLGSLAGCSVLWEIGRRGGEPLLERRFGKAQVARTRVAFERWDLLALIVPALLPPPMPFKIFVLSAGVFGVPWRRFAGTLILARGLRYVFWGLLGIVYGAFFFGTKVADTISDKLVHPGVLDIYVVMGGLTGAIIWNIITWLLGLPTSSSHALVSGIAGAAIAKAGFGVLILPGKWRGIVLFIFLGPLIGFVAGALLMTATAWIFRRAHPGKIDGWFRRLQLLSAAVFSLSHGGNDAQKTMGIIWMLLLASGLSGAGEPLPLWVVFSCYGTIAMGTLFGGWRIVKTMGQRITKIRPVGGFCAELSGSITLFLATGLGIPVSTTHTIAGSIVGVGSTQSVSAVRWGLAGNIVWAWVLTIPCSAFIAGLAWWIAHATLH